MTPREELEALERLVAACEADFCCAETEALEGDSDPVALPSSAITFGHIRHARAAIATLRSRLESVEGDGCDWREDMDGVYETSCGQRWSFVDGDAGDHGARFCYHCGKPLVEHKYTADYEEDEDDAALTSTEAQP